MADTGPSAGRPVRARRSELATPASSERMCERAAGSGAGGVGAIGRDGKLVDAAHMRLAANVLHKAALAQTQEGQP